MTTHKPDPMLPKAKRTSNRASYGVMAVLIAGASFAVVAFFGQNLRALSASSANALGGSESSANFSAAAGGVTHLRVERKAIRNFGSNDDGEGRARPIPYLSPSADFRPMPQVFASPLRAGATDDNAEFAEYVKFLASWSDRADTAGKADLLDVRDRRFVRVSDAKGLPIPTAKVCVTDTRTEKTWTGATFGDGRAPFYPRVMSKSASGSYFVEARFGDQTARASWDGKSDLNLVFQAERSMQGAVQLDVLFAIDTTGSMGDEIDRVKSTLLSVTGKLKALGQEFDLRYGAVLYRDRGDIYVTRDIPFTRDVSNFSYTLQSVTAGGGGDVPESVNEALVHAVAAEWRPAAAKVVFLIGDAAPHMDYPGDVTYGESMKLAAQKGIRIHSVAASGLDPLGTLVWRQVAQLTRGKFIFIEYGSAQATAASHGVTGSFKSNNLDDILYEQLKDELTTWGRDGASPAVAQNQNDWQGPIQLHRQ